MEGTFEKPSLRVEELASPADPETKLLDYYDISNRHVKRERFFKEELITIEEYEYDEKGRMGHKMYKGPDGETLEGEEFYKYQEIGEKGRGGFSKDIYFKNPETDKDAKAMKEERYDGKGRIITEMDHLGDSRKDYQYEGEEKEARTMSVTTKYGTLTYDLREKNK